MPIKPEDALTALDIDLSKYNDVKEFTEGFGAEWLRKGEAFNDKEVRDKVFGTINGVLRTKAKKALKAIGVEDVKVEDMDPDALFDLIGERVPTIIQSKVKPLEEAIAKGAKGGPEVDELRNKYGELEKKYSALDGLHQAQVGKYNELETSVRTRELDAKVNGEWDRAIGSQKFRQGLSEFEKEGFISRMRKDYQVKFDDTGAAYAADANGNRIPDAQKAQKFLDLPALIAAKVKEFKLDETNPHGMKPVGGQRPNAAPLTTRTDAERPARQVHPGRALMHR